MKNNEKEKVMYQEKWNVSSAGRRYVGGGTGIFEARRR